MTGKPVDRASDDAEARTPQASPADFGAFLFAPVWVEAGGRPLTVLSALARLGTDPWDEARRLAGMTRPDAAGSLARSLTVLSGRPWTLPRSRRIAARLVAFLPGDGGLASCSLTLPRPLAPPGLAGRQVVRHRALVLAAAGLAIGLALLVAG